MVSYETLKIPAGQHIICDNCRDIVDSDGENVFIIKSYKGSFFLCKNCIGSIEAFMLESNSGI